MDDIDQRLSHYEALLEQQERELASLSETLDQKQGQTDDQNLFHALAKQNNQAENNLRSQSALSALSAINSASDYIQRTQTGGVLPNQTPLCQVNAN
jgi:hypothetical protein